MDAEQQKNESGDIALQANAYENISRSGTETLTRTFSRIPDFAANELIRLGERDRDYQFVENMFLTGMGNLKRDMTIEAINRSAHSSLNGKAQARDFEIFLDAMEEKRRSTNINVKFGWYGNSKEEISKILRYGFSQYEGPENGGWYGCGIYLVTESLSILSVPSAVIDEDGLQHLLLCRTILGNQEVVHPGSKQFRPSSEEFDSGIDDRLTPKKYIVWSAHMNKHILPEYIISFRVLSFPSGL